MDYKIENAAKRAKENPGTFTVPKLSHIKAIKRGSLVKLIFRAPKPQKGLEGERMWVQITKILPCGRYVGKLDNEPFFLEGLKHGDTIKFSRSAIADIS